MKRSLETLAVTSLLIAAAITVAPPVTAQSDDLPTTSQTEDRFVPQWGMQISVIPNILRMHCPILDGNVGVLVAEVTKDGHADQQGLRHGDVILEINGTRVQNADELPAPVIGSRGQPDSEILVLRRGHVQTTGQLGSTKPSFSDNPGNEVRRMVERMMRQAPRPPVLGPRSSWNRPNDSYGLGINSGAYASSSSSGNESMSVSQANGQISIEMSSPDGGANIRLHGTMADVERQMQDQGLSPATQQKVRRALGR